MSTSEIATVLAWHDALNAKDLDTLVDLSTDDIEIGAADGAAQGLAALRDWASALTDTAAVGKMYVHDETVVFEQTVGDQTFASAFRVAHDRVASMFRHDTLAQALAATDLTEDDLDA